MSEEQKVQAEHDTVADSGSDAASAAEEQGTEVPRPRCSTCNHVLRKPKVKRPLTESTKERLSMGKKKKRFANYVVKYVTPNANMAKYFEKHPNYESWAGLLDDFALARFRGKDKLVEVSERLVGDSAFMADIAV